MPLPPRYGPNHAAVVSFITGLDAVPWFSRLGQPTDQDDRLVRVDFDFLARHHAQRYAPWGDSILHAETMTEQVIFEQRRLTEQAEIQRAISQVGPNRYLDAFYDGLEVKYPGYYGDTCSYAHELVERPDRLLIGAASEIMVADANPNLTFFQGLMPWLRAGHWPCGWDGKWPDGKLILW
jgi:hypothetical protein